MYTERSGTLPILSPYLGIPAGLVLICLAFVIARSESRAARVIFFPIGFVGAMFLVACSAVTASNPVGEVPIGWLNAVTGIPLWLFCGLFLTPVLIVGLGRKLREVPFWRTGLPSPREARFGSP